MTKTSEQLMERALRIGSAPQEVQESLLEAVDAVMDMFDPDSPNIGVIISVSGPVVPGSTLGEARMMPVAMDYGEMVNLLIQLTNTLYKTATANAPARDKFN